MPEFRMPSINQVALSGRVTHSPEARQPEIGLFHLTFSVAVERPYTDSSGIWQKETTTVPVRASGKLAEYTAERLHKGKAVFLTGRLTTRGTVLEVAARHIQFLDQEMKSEEHEPCASSLK